jgi:hypothetical protein
MTRGTAVLAALALTACGGGVDVKTDYDPAAVQAMNSYKTYSWATAKRDQTVSNLNAQRIVDAIDHALASKGFTKQASGGDFQVAFIASTAQQTDYTTTNDYYGYGWGRWYGGGGMSTSRTTAYNWQQGTLVLDIVDGKSNQMVYRSTAQAEVDQDLTPTERQTRLNAGALKMLEKFPPK